MQDILIKNTRIVQANSPHHNKLVDILISNGFIKEIGKIKENKSYTIVENAGMHTSAGWLDLRVHLKDPGFEENESLETLEKVAAAGGYTHVLGLPNTQPVIENKESIAYFKNFNLSSAVTILNAAALSKNTDGKEFTEILDLHHSGAKAFTDGSKTLTNSDLFLKGLLYISTFNGLLINKAEDPTLSLFGQMHEGKESTLLGLKGIPEVAEELMIQRDLKLLEYSGISSDQPILHFSCVSTQKGLELIKQAKKNNLPISCDIAAHQLAFTDADLSTFDPNFKVSPPFRNNKKSLLKGLKDGTIDCVVSDHNPWSPENKNLEFDLSEFGIVGLETAFATLKTYSNLSLDEIIIKVCDSPRKLLKVELPQIEVGQAACLTFFDPDKNNTFTEKDLKSTSKNTPFLNKELQGTIYGVYNNGKLLLN